MMDELAITTLGNRRDNVVANLVFGLCLGFTQIGRPLTMVPLAWRRPGGLSRGRWLDPESLPAVCRVLLVPYWISAEFWDMNFAELKNRHPELRIATFTGTSPFWPGCPTVDCGADGFHLNENIMDASRRENFAAIDAFLVVKARPDVPASAVTEVGMGRLPELCCGPKTAVPLVVLDFLSAWDGGAYRDAACRLAALMRSFPKLQVLVLGANTVESDVLPQTDRVVRTGSGRIPFERLARFWAQAWATVCHNESFGYPIVENSLSGTKVFASSLAQIPGWHRPLPLDALADHLEVWSAWSSRRRLCEARTLTESYERENSELCSWHDVAGRIVEAFFHTRRRLLRTR